MNYTLMRFPGFRYKAATLSYDDGVIYDKKLIEIMSKNGLKGTFNINSGFFSASERRLSKEEVLELYTNSGNEVAIHGRKHLSLTEVPSPMVVNDVLEDRKALEELFGKIITGMAYANSSYNDIVVEILKNCGVEYARIGGSTENFDIPSDWLRWRPTCHHKNPRLMELTNKFFEEEPKRFWGKKPRLFYLWGHSYEFNDDDNWYIIEEFAEFMGNREDVWYATNYEIYKYVKAFDSLKFSVDGKLIENPSNIDVYLNYFENSLYSKEIVVPAGKTIRVENPL